MDKDVAAIDAAEEREARFAYLVMLGDAIRPLADPQEVKSVASRLLGERLKASWVSYGEIAPDGSVVVERTQIDGAAYAAPRPHLDDYDPAMFKALSEGRAVVVEDVEAEAACAPAERLAVFQAAGCRAYAATPIMRDGVLVGALSLVQSTPRRWTRLELTLLDDTAARTWEAIERARAEGRLRASERRLSRVLDHVPVGVGLFDADGRFTFVNDRLRAFVGDVIPALDPGAADHWISEKVDGARFASAEFPGARALKGEDTPNGVRFEHSRRDGSKRWVRMAAMATRDDEGRAQGGVMVLQDVDDEVCAERRLAGSEARLRSLIEGLPQLIWRAAGDGRWIWSSPQWNAYTGQSDSDSAGDGWIEAVHPEDRETTRAAWRDALVSGVLHIEHRLRNARSQDWRWFQTRAAPVMDDHGAIAEWMGACTDIDALRRLQERQRSLLGELQHRTRNLMAVVQAIGAASAEGGATVADYQRRFRRRLAALGRAQTLLAGRLNGEPVLLTALLRAELESNETMNRSDLAGKVTLDGPANLAIRPRSVQILTLALHELVANAGDHGALSQPDGRLAVRWSRRSEAPARVRFEWRETHVDLPRPPGPSRFGREIIEQALTFQAGADVGYVFMPDGLSCTIEADIGAV